MFRFRPSTPIIHYYWVANKRRLLATAVPKLFIRIQLSSWQEEIICVSHCRALCFSFTIGPDASKKTNEVVFAVFVLVLRNYFEQKPLGLLIAELWIPNPRVIENNERSLTFNAWTQNNLNYSLLRCIIRNHSKPV